MYLSDLASHRASLSLSDFLFSLFYLAFTSLKTTDFVRSTIKTSSHVGDRIEVTPKEYPSSVQLTPVRN